MPIGTVSYDDAPDIIVTLTSGERIGIEITECIYDETQMRNSQFQIKFNQLVIQELTAKMPYSFYLIVDLKSDEPIRQADRNKTINEIIDVCLREFRTLANFQDGEVQQINTDISSYPPHVQQVILNKGYRNLPKGIKSIRIRRLDGLKESFHPQSKGGNVPNFSQHHLDKILAKKENSLKNYKICEQYWLLISEGMDFYSYHDNIEVVTGFNTVFDKVFMTRRWPSLVVVLK